LKLDPKYVQAWVARGWTFVIEFQDDWTDGLDRDRMLREMDEASRRATELDERDAGAWDLRAIALGYQWRWAGAFEAVDRGLLLDPTHRSDFLFDRAWLFQMTGRSADVLQVLEEEQRTRGTVSPDVMRTLCRAYLALDRLDEAIDECERAAVVDNYWPDYLSLTAAYSLKGDMAKAAIAKSQLLHSALGFTVSRYRRKQ
jgi:tetratricopeptide (TPR) repeat protein